MTAPDDRWCELRGELAALRSSLTERIEKLESPSPKEPPSLRQRLLDLLAQALVPIISGAVILLLGYAVKDSVDQALRREQLHLSYVSQMQELLEKMRTPAVTREQAESAAIVLATFGPPAAAPLVNELQFEGVRALAAQSGLRTMALIAPEKACELLTRILTNRSRLYRWETHKRAIALLGDLECTQATATLEDYHRTYRKALGEDAYRSLDELIARDSRLDRDSMDQIGKTLDETLAILHVTGG